MALRMGTFEDYETFCKRVANGEIRSADQEYNTQHMYNLPFIKTSKTVKRQRQTPGSPQTAATPGDKKHSTPRGKAERSQSGADQVQALNPQLQEAWGTGDRQTSRIVNGTIDRSLEAKLGKISSQNVRRGKPGSDLGLVEWRREDLPHPSKLRSRKSKKPTPVKCADMNLQQTSLEKQGIGSHLAQLRRKQAGAPNFPLENFRSVMKKSRKAYADNLSANMSDASHHEGVIMSAGVTRSLLLCHQSPLAHERKILSTKFTRSPLVNQNPLDGTTDQCRRQSVGRLQSSTTTGSDSENWEPKVLLHERTTTITASVEERKVHRALNFSDDISNLMTRHDEQSEEHSLTLRSLQPRFIDSPILGRGAFFKACSRKVSSDFKQDRPQDFPILSTRDGYKSDELYIGTRIDKIENKEYSSAEYETNMRSKPASRLGQRGSERTWLPYPHQTNPKFYNRAPVESSEEESPKCRYYEGPLEADEAPVSFLHQTSGWHQNASTNRTRASPPHRKTPPVAASPSYSKTIILKDSPTWDSSSLPVWQERPENDADTDPNNSPVFWRHGQLGKLTPTQKTWTP